LTIAAAVACLLNVPKLEPTSASNLAMISYRCLVGALIIPPFAAFFLVLRSLGYVPLEYVFQILIMFVTVFIKFIPMLVAMLLVTPVGVTDIIVGEAQDPDESPFACIKCGYDLSHTPGRPCPECGAVQPVVR
jgi:hypothetical protein